MQGDGWHHAMPPLTHLPAIPTRGLPPQWQPPARERCPLPPKVVTVTLTTGCPFPPWGHQTSPALWDTTLGPASLPAFLGSGTAAPPAPTTLHRGPWEAVGPQNKLPEGDEVPHSPLAHHPACCRSPPATFLVAVSPGSDLTSCGGSRAAVTAPGAGSLSPGGALGAAPNCSDTLPGPATGAGVRARTYPHVQTHPGPTKDGAAGRILPTLGMLLPPSSPGTIPQPLAGLHHPTSPAVGPRTGGCFASLGAGT